MSKKRKSKFKESSFKFSAPTISKSNHFPLKHLLVIGLMLVATIGAYANTFHVPFQFDDRPNISENTLIQTQRFSLSWLNQFFKNTYTYSIRIFAFLTFAFNYYIGESNVFGYHLVNLLIHITSGILLYHFLLLTLNLPSLKGRYGPIAFPIALFSSLLFLTHPIQTQSVTYIVQRMTSMAGMFYLLAMLLYVKARLSYGKHRLLYFAATAGSYLLGLFSKENTAILPLFIALYELYFFLHFDLSPKNKKTFASVFGVVLLVVLLMILFWGKRSLDFITGLYQQESFTLTERVLTQFRVVLYYVSLLVYPHPSRLILDYDFPISKGILDPLSTLLSMAIVIGLIGYSIGVAKKRPLLSFFILWYFGNLMIESSIFPLDMVFEHRLYLPMIGPIVLFVILVVRGWEKLRGAVSSKQKTVSRIQEAGGSWRRDLPLWIGLLLIGFLFGLGSYQRNETWKTQVTLWEDCVKKSPNKGRPNYNLGLAYYRIGRYEEAIKAYQKAIHLNPNDPEVYNNIGLAYKSIGSYSEAIKAYNEAIRIKSNFPLALNNLGEVFIQIERYQDAIEVIQKAIQLKPNDSGFYHNLGVAYRKMSRYDEAIAAYQEAIRTKPNDSDAYNNLGLAYYGLRNYQEAIQAFKNAIILNPNDSDFRYNLGVTYTAQGNHFSAIEAYQEAIRIKEDHVKSRFNLGLSYLILKKEDLALEEYKILKNFNTNYADRLFALIDKKLKPNKNPPHLYK